jgi:hypothetical protein
MTLAKSDVMFEMRRTTPFGGAAVRHCGISPWASRPRPGLRWRSVIGAVGSSFHPVRTPLLMADAAAASRQALQFQSRR